MSHDILARRDPRGNYVIPVMRKALELDEVKELVRKGQLEIEELGGDVVALLTRSRSLAARLVALLRRCRLLAI